MFYTGRQPDGSAFTSGGSDETKGQAATGTQVLSVPKPYPQQKGGKKVKAIKALWTDEDGVTTVEYALLLAVLVVGAASIWTALKSGIQSGVNAASAEID